MRTKCNLHTHTRFSDGANTAREMVEAALALGMNALGFSDHGYAPHDDSSMPVDSEAAYRAEIRRLQGEYAGRIELPLVYEHDASMPDTDLAPYDYVIESVHFLPCEGRFLSVDHSKARLERIIAEAYGGDPYRAVRAYFDALCRSIETARADIVGHIGLIAKFNEGGAMFSADDRRWLNPQREAIELAVERNLLVEVNTGAMSRGYRTEPYPDRAALEALKALGGRVIVTSDCHRAEWIDFGFDRAYALLREIGFAEVWVWKDGGFTAEPL